MHILKTLAASAVAIALSVSVADAYPHNPPGPRGGPGTDWHNPPGPRGGPGASPYRHGPWRYHRPFYYGWHYSYWRGRPIYWWPERRCWYAPLYNNPPGPAGRPGTNWRNPTGPRGGPGASPSFCR